MRMENIQAFLRGEHLKYQKITFPYGRSTPGKERKRTCDLIFQDEITGKSVWEVGSRLGYFCLEAVERGAGRVVGWDIDPAHIRQARIISETKGLSIEYEQRDIEISEPEEDFDIVLCINVLQHMFDPIAVLEKLITHTREKLILEVASLGTRDRRKTLGLSFLQNYVLSKTPAMLVGKGCTTFAQNPQKQKKYFFTKKALLHLLQYHRHYFGKVDFYESEMKDRFIVVASKRRIKRLVVVAGPRAAGKTTLARHLSANIYPELAERLEVKSFEGWPIVDADELLQYQDVTVNTLLVSYNFLRPYRKSGRTLERDEALHILETADTISLVTIYTEPERLRQQLEARRLEQQSIHRKLNVSVSMAAKYLVKLALRKILKTLDGRLTKKLPAFERFFKRFLMKLPIGTLKF